MVVANRSPRLDSWLNRMQSRAFHSIIGGVSEQRFHDMACGVRAMRRSVAEALPLYGDLHRFIPALALREGFRVDEVAVAAAPRRCPNAGLLARRLLAPAARHPGVLLSGQVHREAAAIFRVGGVPLPDGRNGPEPGALHSTGSRPGNRQPVRHSCSPCCSWRWVFSSWASVWSARSSCISERRTAARIGCANEPRSPALRDSGLSGEGSMAPDITLTSMRRDVPRLADTTFDLLIVGAGIYGACAAWDASLRGPVGGPRGPGRLRSGHFGQQSEDRSRRPPVSGPGRLLSYAGVDSGALRRCSGSRPAWLSRCRCWSPPTASVPEVGLPMPPLSRSTTWCRSDRNRHLDRDRLIRRGRVISRDECLGLFPWFRRRRAYPGSHLARCPAGSPRATHLELREGRCRKWSSACQLSAGESAPDSPWGRTGCPGHRSLERDGSSTSGPGRCWLRRVHGLVT